MLICGSKGSQMWNNVSSDVGWVLWRDLGQSQNMQKFVLSEKMAWEIFVKIVWIFCEVRILEKWRFYWRFRMRVMFIGIFCIDVCVRMQVAQSVEYIYFEKMIECCVLSAFWCVYALVYVGCVGGMFVLYLFSFFRICT